MTRAPPVPTVSGSNLVLVAFVTAVLHFCGPYPLGISKHFFYAHQLHFIVFFHFPGSKKKKKKAFSTDLEMYVSEEPVGCAC